MEKIITITTMHLNFMLPYKVTIGKYGEFRIYCDKYEFDGEYLYCWVDNDIVFACVLMDIDNIIFERCV